MSSEEKSHQDFLRLFLSNQRAILCYIRSMVPAVQDADDILQETSITLWSKFGEFEPGTNFRAWALKTAYWKVREARQKISRSKLVFDDELLLDVRAAAGGGDRALGRRMTIGLAAAGPDARVGQFSKPWRKSRPLRRGP